MSTTWNIDPHGKDGKIDPKLQEKSVQHGMQMVKEGKEILKDTTQTGPDADGWHQTTFIHKAAG